MEDTLERIWEHLIGRFTGPLTFRLILQPTMATLFAVRDGLRDARTGRSHSREDLQQPGGTSAL